MTVAGVVTAEPGRVLGDRTLVIQDATGGVAVGIPSGTVLPVRGDAVVVRGELVAPYGNLEVRASDPDDLRRIGRGTVPVPLAVTSERVAEALEGRLARIEGTLVGVDGSSSGSLTLTLEDARGEVKVFAFDGAGLDADRYARGQRVKVTGVVGQRASGAGRPDGHRLWPRDPADVVVLAQPTPSPVPTGSGTPTPRPSGGTPTPGPSGASGTTVSIAVARSRPGQDVTVAGTVTTQPGVLDSDGRRVTVQDTTAAILVRLETGGPAIVVGDRIRVTGEVGTYYGALQLGASEIASVIGHGSLPAPAAHARGALPATLEWRLVRVAGLVESVRRDGDGWRADLVLADSTRIPVVALPRAGIPVAGIVAGASATVTGIVRPPYPSSTDRRSAVLPRNARDVTFGARGPSPSADETGTVPSPGDGAGTSSASGGPDASPGPGTGGLGAGGTNVFLADLPAMIGQRVRVGGVVVAVTGTEARLRDSTGEGRLRFGPAAAFVAGTLTIGEVVNAAGVVVRESDGTVLLLVALAEDLQRAGSLGAGPLAGDPTTDPSEGLATMATDAGLTPAGGVGSAAPTAGLGNVTLLAAASLGLLAALLLALGVWPDGRRRATAAFSRLSARRSMGTPPSAAPGVWPQPSRSEATPSVDASQPTSQGGTPPSPGLIPPPSGGAMAPHGTKTSAAVSNPVPTATGTAAPPN
ncbi:MAG: hypothetical protein H0W07_05810 [Chloroflexi bacterium]|nr:hypothetical protein [Chloroflexota bacterium]